MDWGLFERLPSESRSRLLTSARRREFSRNEVVFHEGDPADSVHLIVQGRVAVQAQMPSGETVTLALLGPGEFFGELALLADRRQRTATVRAIEDTETLAVAHSRVCQLRTDDPSFDRLLVKIMAERVHELSRRLLEAFFVPVRVRVMRQLLRLAELYARGGSPAVIPLTQEEVAALSGTTRSTVNRVLRKAEETGLVAVRRSAIEIVDLVGVRRKAG